MDTKKQIIRNVIDGVYDVQKLRIATGNRIVASMRPEVLDKIKEESKGDSDKEQKEKDTLLAKIILEYDKVTDFYVEQCESKGRISNILLRMPGEREFIKTEIDYELVTSYKELQSTEERLTKVVDKLVQEHPLYDAFFKDVKGCGALMSAVCIAYLDPYKARHVSSFWKYCGLDVLMDDEGKMVGRRKMHTEMRQYTDKKTGELKEKRSITYNPFVKTKLLGVLMGSFLKTGADGKYAIAYYDYRNRMQNRDPDLTPVVWHRRAARYAIKLFLEDLWVAWRKLEGLEVTEPYAVAKLGMDPHHAPNARVIWYDALKLNYKAVTSEELNMTVEEVVAKAKLPEKNRDAFVFRNLIDEIRFLHGDIPEPPQPKDKKK